MHENEVIFAFEKPKYLTIALFVDTEFYPEILVASWESANCLCGVAIQSFV